MLFFVTFTALRMADKGLAVGIESLGFLIWTDNR